MRVAYCHAILRSALSDAVRDELLRRNVATLMEPPRVRTAPVQPLTADEAGAVLAHAEHDRLLALWLVLLGLGLRRGEALALRWDDVDLDAETITISRSLQRLPGPVTKGTTRRRGRLVETATETRASEAKLALPGFVTGGLRAHRRRQAAERLRARVRVDPGIIFTTPLGAPLEPRNVNRAWTEALDRAGVRHLKLHAARHTTASLLLREGVDLKVVQTVLRHSRLATTADIYSHVYDHVKRAAAQRIDHVLGSSLRMAVPSSQPDQPEKVGGETG